MSYMIMSYGYQVKETVTEIETLEEAERIMASLVREWCEEMDMTVDELENYTEGDHYFCETFDELGVSIYELFEVPECKNEYDQLMWELKLDLEMIEYAAEDYTASLAECMVETYAEQAKRKLARLYEIEHP